MCIMLQVSHLYRPYERRDVVVFHPPEEFMKYSNRVSTDEVTTPSLQHAVVQLLQQLTLHLLHHSSLLQQLGKIALA
jgi:hypothetical protein